MGVQRPKTQTYLDVHDLQLCVNHHFFFTSLKYKEIDTIIFQDFSSSGIQQFYEEVRTSKSKLLPLTAE